MTPGKLEVIFQTIHEIVENQSLRWKEKRKRILDLLDEDEEWKQSFEEFISWFEKEEP